MLQMPHKTVTLPYALERTEAIDSTHLNRAISLYQTSSQWNKR